MSDVNEGDAEPAMHIFKLDLHILSHFEVECAERFVKEQNFGFVDQRSRYRHSLLLTARKRGYVSVSVVFEVDHLEDGVNLSLYFLFGIFAVFGDRSAFFVDERLHCHLLEFKPESYVVENVEVREKRILLKDGIDFSEIGRSVRDVLAVEINPTAGGGFESCYHAQGSGFAAARRAEQSDEFAFLNVKAALFDRFFSVVDFADVFKFDDVVALNCVCFVGSCFDGLWLCVFFHSCSLKSWWA